MRITYREQLSYILKEGQDWRAVCFTIHNYLNFISLKPIYFIRIRNLWFSVLNLLKRCPYVQSCVRFYKHNRIMANDVSSLHTHTHTHTHTQASGPLAEWLARGWAGPVACCQAAPVVFYPKRLLQELRLPSNRVHSPSIFLNEGFSQFCVITSAEYLDALPLNYQLISPD